MTPLGVDPCPFCGGDAVWAGESGDSIPFASATVELVMRLPTVWLECRTCGVRQPGRPTEWFVDGELTYHEAAVEREQVERWNRRTT